MKIFLVFVVTADGKITKWGRPVVKSWTSPEDQQYFSGLWNEIRLIVIGSGTYNANPPKPSEKKLIVVLTRHPEKYKRLEIPGQVLFVNDSPLVLAKRFSEEGYDKMMLAGGARVATSFFREGLIDELWLTVEPMIFGSGGNFVADEKLDIRLKMLSCETVNESGTLIIKYGIIK